MFNIKFDFAKESLLNMHFAKNRDKLLAVYIFLGSKLIIVGVHIAIIPDNIVNDEKSFCL